MKAKTNKIEKISYKEMLAKALGKPIAEVKTSAEVTGDTEKLFAKAKENAKSIEPPLVPYKAPKKNGKTSQQLLSETEEFIIENEELDDKIIEIVEMPIVKSKKIIAQNSEQAQKILAKAIQPKPEVALSEEEVKLARRKEISAIALAAKRSKKEAVETTIPEVKAVVKPIRTITAKPAIEGKKPISKMSVSELEDIKGTISDTQWNKYFKEASKGNTAVAPVVAKPNKAPKVAPIEKEILDAIAPVPPVKFQRKVTIPVPGTLLADYSLDDLLAELKRRGCKGIISVCTEIEL